MKFENILNNLIPCWCGVCKRITIDSHICTHCLNLLKIKNEKRCNTCFKPLLNDFETDCIFCQEDKMPFSKIRFLWEYKELPSIFIKNLKYENNRFLIKYAKEKLLEKYIEFFEESEFHDIIIPSPSSAKSVYKRGFLHTYVLSKSIFKFLKSKNKDVKILKYNSFPSSYFRKSELPINERFKQINYDINLNLKDFYNKKVLFLDDMITTGSTAFNIYRMIKNYDIASFDVLTLGAASDFHENFENMILNKFTKLNKK